MIIEVNTIYIKEIDINLLIFSLTFKPFHTSYHDFYYKILINPKLSAHQKPSSTSP